MPLPNRILWLTWKDTSHPLAGGAETVNEEIAKRLAARGVGITFIVGGFPGGEERVERDGYRIERVGNRWTAYYHAWRLYRAKYRGWADLIIDEVNTIPFMARWYADAPVLMFFHQLCREIWFYQLPQPLSTIGYLIEPLYLRMLSRTPAITVSDSTRRDLLRYGWRADDVRIISEGITMEPVGSLPPPRGGRLGGGGNELPSSPHPSPPHPGEGVAPKAPHPTVLILGAIREMKRTDHAIRAFELAKQAIPDLRLIVAGGNGSAYGRKVTAMITASEYASDITSEGRVSDARRTELMQVSHVLLSCAVKEGWGLTVTEANSQGTPAIVYDADGLRDSVRHGETGIVCPPTPADMAASIVSLLSDHSEYERLRRSAWEWSKTLSFDRATEDFVRAIDHLASPR